MTALDEQFVGFIVHNKSTYIEPRPTYLQVCEVPLGTAQDDDKFVWTVLCDFAVIQST